MLSDRELIELFLFRGGRDERPYAELFRRHRQLVWRVALGYFGNPQDAEDMTQDVFFLAFRNLRQFKGEASFRTWIHRIAANRCKNELRQRSRRPRTIREPVEEAAAALVDRSPGPEATVAARRALARLARSMSALGPEERRIIERVDIEQTPYLEVAKDLGVSLGAVKMRVLRARSRLQEEFEMAGQRREE